MTFALECMVHHASGHIQNKTFKMSAQNPIIQMSETDDKSRILPIRVLACDKCQVSVCKFDWSKSQLIT